MKGMPVEANGASSHSAKSAVRWAVCVLCRAWPYTRGLQRVAQSWLAKWLVEGMDEPQPARLVNRLYVYVVPSDYDGRWVYLTGDQDRAISRVCCLLLRPGDVAIDVGANCGVITHWCAHAVGRNGVVHAFEPQASLAKAIRESAALNNLTNIEVHNLALSDTDAVEDLFVPHGHSGGGSLGGRRHQNGRMEEVRLAHAGEFLRSLGLASIRLLKLDAEGHESNVIGGMGRLLEKGQVDFVLFEALDDAAESRVRHDLENLGYTVYGVVRKMLGVSFVPAEANKWKVCDYLAVRKGLRPPAEVARSSARPRA